MIIYFLRHANAGETKKDPKKDEQRGLDATGVAQCFQVAHLFSRLELVPDVIVTSPLKRAMQTAAMVANEIGYDDRLRVDKALRPEARWEDFRPMLKSYNADVVIVVGHNPNLGQFVGRIISNSSNRADIDLKKGGIARVEYDGRNGELQWLLTPKFIREANAGLLHEHSPLKEQSLLQRQSYKVALASPAKKLKLKAKNSKSTSSKNRSIKKKRNSKKK